MKKAAAAWLVRLLAAVSFSVGVRSVSADTAATNALDALAEARPKLSLVWYDSYRLMPRVLGVVISEIETIFSEMGIEIRWLAEQGRAAPADGSASWNVILLPVASESWNIGKRVMGASIGRRDEGFNVFLFYPNILRTLGLDRGSRALDSPRGWNELARAVARIVAHEVVHAALPSRPHASEGLMRSGLGRRALLEGHARIDPMSARALREILTAGSGKAELTARAEPAPPRELSRCAEWL